MYGIAGFVVRSCIPITLVSCPSSRIRSIGYPVLTYVSNIQTTTAALNALGINGTGQVGFAGRLPCVLLNS